MPGTNAQTTGNALPTTDGGEVQMVRTGAEKARSNSALGKIKDSEFKVNLGAEWILCPLRLATVCSSVSKVTGYSLVVMTSGAVPVLLCAKLALCVLQTLLFFAKEFWDFCLIEAKE